MSLKQLFNTILFIPLTILVFATSTANAQYYRYGGGGSGTYGIGLVGSYDVPVGNLGYTFKPAIGYGVSVFSYHGNFTSSITIGYHAYKPKLDTFYYQVDQTNYGTVHYDNYTAISIYLGVAYNFEISDGVKVYAGLNLGAYYTHMAFHSSDLYVDDTENLGEKDAYLAPKIGFTYSLNDNVAIGIEGKYNLFAPTGRAADNPLVGTVYSSYAGSFILTYNF
ncbi:hypothetical protein [Mucilaginibacter gotjawali]|uniref:hypothetical protein n=1 Tax=Mucilaginibacter gotjawali TaxID=1550579 RepID=UPI0012FDAC1F|nr:hypothetical protein [Mucilaginibacter gotjawali]